ncbi:hypothetical protein J1N35_041569 [Gossypium stocksii]|uniref:Uncharacterized protein n=1 Tax=Gossypium stocksii TaxID=47602 RepID=A0A9D3UG15_9ROSI|nr:hypothetical protein J1N35_041569 [Gossypium stocksii]
MTMVPTGNGIVIPALTLKQLRVSAIREFLPGCGRITVPSSKTNELVTVDRSSQGKW